MTKGVISKRLRFLRSVEMTYWMVVTTGGMVEMTPPLSFRGSLATEESSVSFGGSGTDRIGFLLAVEMGIMAKNVCWKCSFSLYFVYDIDKKVKPF